MPFPAADVDEPDERAVRTLLAAVPDLDLRDDLPLEFVSRGWDNSVWKVGERWAARIPIRAEAVPLLLNEAEWGAEVAAPFVEHGAAASVPVRLVPAGPHPYPWLLTRWVEGELLEHLPVPDRGPVAAALAVTLPHLHRPAPREAPVNPYRGLDLADVPPPRDDAAASSRERFGSDFAALEEVYAAGRAAARWTGPRVWCHGDLHPRNLLLRDALAGSPPGAALGLLDFGDLTAGDPASDLGVLWLAFDEPQRQGALERLLPHYDDAVVDRARGWAARFVIAVGGVYPEPFAATLDHARDQLLR